MESLIQNSYTEHLKTIELSLVKNSENLIKAGEILVWALKNGNKVLICGNGGSAADAQHIAAELTGRYKKERISLPGIALSVDTSAITAIGNDYSFEEIFSRQLEGLGKNGDVLIVLSTSGNSENILRTISVAQKKWISTIGLLGKNGGKIAPMVDVAIIVPSDNTPRIQECHILLYHILCEYIDEQFV
jgi:D-sedoheptulose 7-phosphate isomerase